MLRRRFILCCDTSITRSWHGQCVSFKRFKGHKTLAGRFFERLVKERSDLFVHWQKGMVGVFALWEPSEARASRSVLREAGGEITSAYSTVSTTEIEESEGKALHQLQPGSLG